MTNRSLPLALAAAATAIVLSLTGCAGGGTSDPTRAVGDPGSSHSAPPGVKTDVFTVEPGDCVDDTDDENVTELPVVDCAGPHDFEAFTSFEFDPGEYPGDDAVHSHAQEACAAAMGEFVGLSYDDSTLDVQYLTPTEDSWNGLDDRTVVCLVYDPAGKLTGTVENAAI
ncbi:septum formation family protein [Herbiconiux sp. CPCC 205716]|uniref:Septum formation family protein n=1 Tax=Herbiconiux gentiana TaxID=2970912 RepID=A0ABT2GJG6_9MICO|nr:septum formation family protein [Herbiconiux gentiana]MCS5716347.1 septum formation family protein [Herbiconiux gentiana]